MFESTTGLLYDRVFFRENSITPSTETDFGDHQYCRNVVICFVIAVVSFDVLRKTPVTIVWSSCLSHEETETPLYRTGFKLTNKKHAIASVSMAKRNLQSSCFLCNASINWIMTLWPKSISADAFPKCFWNSWND